MHALRNLVRTVDRATYMVERAVLLVSVFLMTGLIFLDVIQRTFSRPVGKTETLVLAVVSLFVEPSDSLRETILGTVGPAVFVAAGLALVVAGTHAGRSAKSERAGRAAPSFASSAGIGALIYALLAGVVKGLLLVAPSGIPGAQKLALGLLVWCGFLGASVAAREKRHIVLDAVKKKLDAPTHAIFSTVGALLTASVCLFLAYMSGTKTTTMIREWSESGGAIHRFESVPIPEWLVTVALPITFTLIALRFLAQGVGELLFGAPLHAGGEEHGVNLAALEQQSHEQQNKAAVVVEVVEAEVRIYGRPHPTKGRLS